MQRRRLRLVGFDYATTGAYFITVCTRDRACLLGQVNGERVVPGALGRLVEESWTTIPRHHGGWELDTHVVVPNHIHGILIQGGAGQVRPLQEVVGAFKAQASRRAGRPLWQRGYHDRIIRNERELLALREYISTNPLRWARRLEDDSIPSV